MTRRSILSFVAFLVFVSIPHSAARTAELRVFASRAVWTVLTAIGPEFEKNSGHKLNTTTGLSAEFVRRINSGEGFDVVAAPPASLEGLIKAGKIVPGSQIGIARSGYGVVVRAGATISAQGMEPL